MSKWLETVITGNVKLSTFVRFLIWNELKGNIWFLHQAGPKNWPLMCWKPIKLIFQDITRKESASFPTNYFSVRRSSTWESVYHLYVYPAHVFEYLGSKRLNYSPDTSFPTWRNALYFECHSSVKLKFQSPPFGLQKIIISPVLTLGASPPGKAYQSSCVKSSVWSYRKNVQGLPWSR